MIPADATAIAALAAQARGAAWLIDLAFVSGTLRYTNWPMTVVSGGNTYTSFGTNADVAPIKHSSSVSNDKLALQFSVANAALLSSAIGGVDNYRNRRATVSLQLFDVTFQPIGAKLEVWVGLMDRVEIKRKDQGGTIEMLCSRAGMPRARSKTGMRLTNAQQQFDYPGDLGLEYVATLIEKPTAWLSKRFQTQ